MNALLLGGGIALAAGGILGIIAALIVGDRLGHQGADEDYAVELHHLATDPPTAIELAEERVLVRPYVYGRHHEDTVELRRVPADWMPPSAEERIRAATTDTEWMEPL